jgi:hypothetical protein
MVEMETMAPVVTLKPGESSVHTETWVLADAAPVAPASSTLRQLFC